MLRGDLGAADPRDRPARTPCATRNAGGRLHARECGRRRLRARLAEALAENDDKLLAAYVDERSVPYRTLRTTLAAQTERALVHPVFFGSALTGAGVDSLMAGIAELLPAAEGDADGPVSGTVFKIERAPPARRSPTSGCSRGRCGRATALRFGRDFEEKVTAIRVFDRGSDEQRAAVSAGEIGKLWGLGEIQIGDGIGEPGTAATRISSRHRRSSRSSFRATPTTRGRSASRSRSSPSRTRSSTSARTTRARRSPSRSTARCRRRSSRRRWPTTSASRSASARRRRSTSSARRRGRGRRGPPGRTRIPFLATVGLRVDPAPTARASSSGWTRPLARVPIYIYKTAESFSEAMTPVRPRHARGGPPRLAGHRLRRDDDRLRLLRRRRARRRRAARRAPLPPTSGSSRRWS